MTLNPGRNCHLALFLFLISQLCTVNAQSQKTCEALDGFSDRELNFQVTAAEWRENFTPPPGPFGPPPASQEFPPHCHVEGEIDKRIGHDDKPYAIGFAVNLPADWNGRFMFQGGGGLNGSVGEPLGINASADIPALTRGFAVASTDSGHTGAGGFDASFFADQEAVLNFYFLGVARASVVAKKIVAEFYDNPADYSYYVGCSTGGREGMIMSQRFPYYYDGIVSGAPAMRTGASNLALKWISVELNQVAQRDAAGEVIAGSSFTEEQRTGIVDALLETCDANDGIADGIVHDTNGCDFDPAGLVCGTNTKGICLSPEQATALKKALSGPRNSMGQQVYPGFLYDTGINAKGFIPGLLQGGRSPVDPNSGTVTEMDVDAEQRAISAQDSALGDSLWTNLSSFSGNGGKLIFYHGVSDAWFSSQETIRYYKEMSTINGGMDEVRNWSRAFLVPGMGHCSGGQSLDKFDMVGAIVDWVENDRAPDSVTATGRAFPGRSRPLCPYPQFAHYLGKGDPEDAANFECME